MGRMRKAEVPVVKDSEKKHVLIAILGVTPAVLTEAVWALATQRGIVPDEIVVFTTTTGRKQLTEEVLASGVWSRLLKALRDEGHDVKGKFKFDEDGSVYLFKDANRTPIEDLRSREDNLEAANMMMKEIREFAEDGDWVIHALLSGGRKTMTALFFSCMCLQARSCDRIYHVLASEKFEKKLDPLFCFPEKGVEHEYVESDENGKKKTYRLKSEDAKIDLFEVPFVYMGEWAEQRCRAISKKLSYENLINDIQGSVNHELYPDRVVLDFSRGQVGFDGKAMEASAVNFMVLAFLLQGYSRQNVITKMIALKVFLRDKDDEDIKFRDVIMQKLPWLYKLGWRGKEKDFQQKFLHDDKKVEVAERLFLDDFGRAKNELKESFQGANQDALFRFLFEGSFCASVRVFNPASQVVCRTDGVPKEFLEYFFPEDAPIKFGTVS